MLSLKTVMSVMSASEAVGPVRECISEVVEQRGGSRVAWQWSSEAEE
jgi:hypothetical protein